MDFTCMENVQYIKLIQISVVFTGIINILFYVSYIQVLMQFTSNITSQTQYVTDVALFI